MNPKKLVRKVLPRRGVRLAEEAYRRGRIYSLQARFGFPARNLRIIAITGTNGKTTTCCFVNEILKSAGYRTAMYTTAVIELDNKSRPNTTHRTLPLTENLLRFFRSAKKLKCDFVVLEVTSQALDQHKLVGVPIEVAALTNLTQDHLDYHGTMARYAEAKARLFNGYSNPKYCVLNADDESYDYFLLESAGQAISYGKGPDSAERIGKVLPSGGGMKWQLLNGSKAMDLCINLPGLFNVYNASAAATIALVLGVKPKHIAKGLADLDSIAGRAETIEAGQTFTVWVDYAVTPDALSKVLEAAHMTAKGKVALVFGATGDRDKSKRQLMGQAAAKGADRIYLTDDETYNEDPELIRDTVYKGIKQASGIRKTKIVADRKKAIETAFKEADEGDLVILAGIGHQDSRNMGGKKEPWNERAVAESLLKNRTG